MVRLAVLAAVFLTPQYFSLWVSESRTLVGFSVVNWALATAVLFALLRWLGTHAIRRQRGVRFPLNWSMLLLFILPYVVSHLIGYPRAEEIPVTLAYRDGGFSSLSTWYLSHLGMSLLTTVGIAMAITYASQDGLCPSRLLIAAALPVWATVVHAGIATFTSDLSLAQLTSEENRSFLQDQTDVGVHGNAFGQYALFAYILFIGAARGSKNSLKTFFLATAVVATGGVVVSFSRAAWGVWVFVTTFWNAKDRGNSKWLVPAVITGILLMMPDALFQRVWKGVADGDVDQILSGRLDHMWLPVLQEVWIKPLFGQGWGAYMWSEAFTSGIAFQTATVHNAYIRLLLESGVVGLSLVMAFYLALWREASEMEKTASDPWAQAMMRTARWLVAAMLLTGVTGDAITPEMIQVYFWYGIGIVLAVRLTAHRQPETIQHLTRVAA